MTFVYFTDDDGSEIGVPLKSITEIKFDKDKDKDNDPDLDELTITVKGNEYYSLSGKGARKAWEEIRIQIMATGRNFGVNR